MSRKTTKLEDLSNVVIDIDKKEEENPLDEENLSKTVVDMTLEKEIRLQALETFYNLNGLQETLEITSRLGMMYQMSGLKSLRNYMYEICVESGIHVMLKAGVIKNLCTYDRDDDSGFKALDIVFPSIGHDIPMPVKVELVVLLMYNKKYTEQARNYLCEVVNDDHVECDYRYKIILGLEHKLDSKKLRMYFIKEACLEFLDCVKNMTRYRVLAGQNLLRNCKITDDQKAHVEEILLSFASDNELDYNIRADAADVVLQLGSDENKETSREIIMMLGRGDRGTHTVFDNAQNVHTEEVEESVNEIIEFLNQFELMTISGKAIEFEYVEKKINDVIKEERKELELKEDEKYEREEKIDISLNRIYMDRALYGTFNCSLMTIILKVWTYMNGHEHEDEMKVRLMQELEEMSGTCSTGYASRLVNSITGFGDLSIRISWRDQIIANVAGRLNARAREIDDLDFQEKVLNEMMVNTKDFKSRRNFLRFFRKNILSIRQEMYQEFKEHLDDTTFDLYFRSAISNYESGEWV
jgi:hypothetical protein